MDRGITIAGNLIVDNVKNVDVYPEEGLLTNIRQMKSCIGGCAGNTSVDLAIIDQSVPLSCLGMVGDDEMGKYVLDLLDSHGVRTTGIRKSRKATSFTDVFNNMANGNRTFFHSRGANEDFGYEDIDIDCLETSIFHMGYALLLDSMDAPDREYGTAMAHVLADVKKKGIKTSLDVVSEKSDRFKKIVIPSLRYCSYAIMNEIEAGMITGVEPRSKKGDIIPENIREMCRRMMACGVEEYVIIHMPEMGCAMDSQGRFYFAGSYKIPPDQIRGTVGAGDAFCAGMLYSLYREWEIEKALVFANGAAVCNLGAEDSISGMKSAEDIETVPYDIRQIGREGL